MSEEGISSFEETIARAAGSYFAPHIRDLAASPYHHHYHLARMLAGNNDNLYRISTDSEDLRKFSLVQAHHAARILKAQAERLESETTPV